MNKKLMLGMIAFSATASLFGSDLDKRNEPGSPLGYHGTTHGGMCGKVFSGTNLDAMPAAIQVVRQKADGELVASTLIIDSQTTVYNLKNQFMDSGWVASGYRIERDVIGADGNIKREEIMREYVDPITGTLITLGQVFVGVTEMPTIHLIADTLRSPLPSTTASPAAEESQLAASAE